MTEPLLQIRNRHSVACGDPPIVRSDDPNVYVGYYENQYGEQWIFTLDRTTRQALLRGGDIGWNTTLDVSDGELSGLNLAHDEYSWLKSCWRAAVSPTG